MTQRQLKNGYFVLEGLNSFATTYYLYYLYFFTQTVFGFGNKANLAIAAMNGLVYALFSWWGGRYAEKAGYFKALKVGFVIMAGALSCGLWVTGAAANIVIMAIMVIGMCFTWPTLEALVSHGEDRRGIQDMVGIYNVVWAATGAIAYFTGGLLLEKLGMKSLFYVPVAIQVTQLLLTIWLEKQAKGSPTVHSDASAACPSSEAAAHPKAEAQSFLKMAWLANPLGYIAINTLVAVMPGVASKLGLSTMTAGFCCSVWCFARLGTFALLWKWSAWHYKFRWLIGAYLMLIASFAIILLVPNLAVLIVTQLFLGLALGLIYYSSLFYSMDLSDAKGEHGGIHEAAIGLGNFAGPAAGALSLHFLPQVANAGTLAVSSLLLIGLAGLLAIRLNSRRTD